MGALAGAAWTGALGAFAGGLGPLGSYAFAAAGGALAGGISTGTLRGALVGAFTGAAGYGVVSNLSGVEAFFAQSTVGGIGNSLGGGKFGNGFLSAGVGFLSGIKLGGDPSIGKFIGSAIVGGTVSEITGGKFANGATTAALAYVVAAGAAKANSGGLEPLNQDVLAEMDARVAGFNGWGNPDEWLAWGWGDPIPAWIADPLVGWGDSVLFGFGDELRSLSGIDGGINYDSAGYKYAGYTGAVLGGGVRLAYAGAIRGYSLIAPSSAAASSFRTTAGNLSRYGAKRPYQPDLSKYPPGAALRSAAGRSNPYVNSLGVTHIGANVYNLEAQIR